MEPLLLLLWDQNYRTQQHLGTPHRQVGVARGTFFQEAVYHYDDGGKSRRVSFEQGHIINRRTQPSPSHIYAQSMGAPYPPNTSKLVPPRLSIFLSGNQLLYCCNEPGVSSRLRTQIHTGVLLVLFPHQPVKQRLKRTNEGAFFSESEIHTYIHNNTQ